MHEFLGYDATLLQPRPLMEIESISHTLLIIILTLVTDHVEELEAVLATARADDSEPVTQLLLLEEFLRQILEIAAAELHVRDDLDPTIVEVVDGDIVAEVTRAALHLDALLQESCEGGWVEDAVLSWLGCVDDELIQCQQLV